MTMSPKGGEKLLTSPVLVRMTPKLHKLLKALAEEDRRGLAEYIRLVLEDHVEVKRRGK